MKKKKLPAKIIQIQTAEIPAGPNNGQYVELIALCEDGSLWKQYRSNGTANVPTGDEWHLMHDALKSKRSSESNSGKVDEKTRADLWCPK
jgi:photosystem II stability/assembly factor-like uncharacterized protein